MGDYGAYLLAAVSLVALGAAVWLVPAAWRRTGAGRAPRRGQERYREIGEMSPDAMLINCGDEIVYANAAALKLLGASAAHQVIGRSPLDFVYVDDLPAVRSRIERVMKDGPLPGLWEQRFVRLDGSIVDVEVNVGVVVHRGVPSRQVVIRDISARKRMEEQLRQSEARYRKLVEASPDATFIIRDVRIEFANGAALQLLGAGSAEQVVGKSIFTFVHPEHHAAARGRIDYVQSDGQESGLRESRYVRLDGSVIDVEISATLIIDQGSPARHVVVRDISARKRVEQALRLSEERYRVLVESSPDATLIYRGDIVEFANAAALKLFGASAPAQIVGHAQREFIHQDVVDLRLPSAVAGCESTAVQQTGLWEQKFVRLDGSTFDAEGSSTPIVDQRGAMRQVILRDITARKHAEEALRLSEERYRTLVETSPDATFISRGGRIDYANAAAMRLLGASVAAEVIGRPLLDFVHPEEQAADRERAAQISRTGVMPGLTETRYVRLDASVVPVEISATLVFDQKGSARHVVARDISARKRAEAALRESEDRLHTAVDAAQMIDWEWDVGADRTQWGNQPERLLGPLPAGAAGYREFRDMVHADDWARVLLAARNTLAEDAPYDVEFRLVRTDGAVRWLRHSGRAIRAADGRARRISGVAQDITRRREAELELEESRRRHRDLLEGIPDVAYLKNREGRYLAANRAWASRHGIAAASIFGKTDREIFPAARAAANIEEDQRVVQSRAELRVERVVELNGVARWFETIKTPIIDEHGEVTGTVGISRDITERRRAEAALRESEARLQAIMDNSAALISLRDAQGRYMLVNRRYAELLQLAPDAFVGQSPDALFSAELAGQLIAEHRRILETRASSTSEVRVPTPHGARVFIANSFALLDAAGAPYAVGCVGTDITQHERDAETLRRVNEELSLKAAELTALNKELEAFSYSVSHDLRAPLRHIDGFVNMLRQHAGAALEPAAEHYMQRIEGASSTMTRLIDDLLTFSRAGRGVLNKIPLALDRMIAEVVDDLKPDIGARRVVWNIGVLPVVHGDRNLLRQVFFNLIENAVKYTRPRDEARIDISCVDETTDVIIAIRDNGVGFDMQYAHKLFGVFQRLHSAEEFEGTGIGLANVSRIVQRHGGRVWAEGEKGRGAAFFVALPSWGAVQS